MEDEAGPGFGFTSFDTVIENKTGRNSKFNFQRKSRYYFWDRNLETAQSRTPKYFLEDLTFIVMIVILMDFNLSDGPGVFNDMFDRILY
jgi:hypothetical protein